MTTRKELIGALRARYGSAATIDRALAGARSHIDGQRKRRKGVGAAIRRSIPVRTFADWRDPPPGFLEIDMVEHCGGQKTDGDFVHSLVLTDIARGWSRHARAPIRRTTRLGWSRRMELLCGDWLAMVGSAVP